MKEPMMSGWAMYREAWGLYKQNVGAVIILSTIPALLFLAATVLSASNFTLVAAISMVGYAISVALSLLALLVVLVSKAPTITSALRQGFGFIVPLVVGVLIAFFTSLGAFALFFIPAIWIGILLSVWIYAFIADNKRGFDALVTSWYLVKGSWWSVLYKQLVLVLGLVVPLFVAAFIFAIPAFLVGGPAVFAPVDGGDSAFWSVSTELMTLFFFNPMSVLFGTVLYRALKAQKPEEPTSEEAARIRSTITKFMILGVIASVILIALTIAVLVSQ